MDERRRKTDLEKEVLLHEAVITNDAEMVRRILDDRGSLNVNCRNNHGRTPVHLAASRGNAEILALLVKAGCDVEAKDKFGMRPLHMAAWYGRLEAAELLIEAGASVSALDKRKRTLPMMAVRSSCGDIFLDRIIGILEPAEEATARDCEGASVLHYAARAGHPRAIASLYRLLPQLDLDARDLNGQTPLHLACAVGHHDAASKLLDLGAALELTDAEGRNVLHLAVRARESRLCCWLMDRRRSSCRGASSEAVGSSSSSSTAPTNELLRVPDRRGQTPLHVAAALGCVVILRAILDRGAVDGTTELMDERCQGGDTPLHLAARHNQPEVVDILAESGAALDSVNDDMLTPLQIATVMGHSEVCRQLLAERRGRSASAESSGSGGRNSSGSASSNAVASKLQLKATAEGESTALRPAVKSSFATIAGMIARTARLDCPAQLLIHRGGR